MTDRADIESAILEVLVDLGSGDASSYYDNDGTIEDIDIKQDLGLNDVDCIELTLALEDAFNVEIDTDTVISNPLISDLIDYVDQLLQ